MPGPTFGGPYPCVPVPFPSSYRICIGLLGCVFAIGASGQQNNVPLQRDFYVELERNASLLNSRVHSGLKPVIESRADLTDVMGHRKDTTKYYYLFTEKLFRDHLLDVKGDGYRLTLDPLFEQQYGWEEGAPTPYADTNRFYVNTRGFRITGDLDKVSFQTMFHETQGIFPEYVFWHGFTEGVLIGHGRTKIVDGRKVDVGFSQANVSYSPSAWLNVQLGHGRHFVGHGYRSMLLSDHAMDAPYLKFSILALKGRLQYSTWNSKLMHRLREPNRLPTGDANEALFYWMRARFNHLSVDLGRVQLGLFEATIYRNINSEGVMPFDAQELNPVIGLNTALNGFNGDYKTLIGADLRVKLVDKCYAYGQWATDRPGERLAWQAGLRVFDLLRKDLHLQLEFNKADPFMYMHHRPTQAYMHASLPLAHPSGAAFQEFVAILEQSFGRMRIQGKVIMARDQRDGGAEWNMGSDLRKPDLPQDSPQGPVVMDRFHLDANLSYLVNPVSNLRLVGGFMRRDLDGGAAMDQSGLFYIAIRTSLFNRYHDF